MQVYAKCGSPEVEVWKKLFERELPAVSDAAVPGAPAREVPARAPSGSFLANVDRLTLRPDGGSVLAVRLRGQALRGRLPDTPRLRWEGASSVDDVGARVLSLASSATMLPATVRSTWERYKAAVEAGAGLALPYTAESVVGYLAVYSGRWCQSSASLQSVVDNLRRHARHFNIEFLTAKEELVVARARGMLEKMYPSEVGFAETVGEEVVLQMVAVLDKLPTNKWALMLAALITLGYDGRSDYRSKRDCDTAGLPLPPSVRLLPPPPRGSAQMPRRGAANWLP